jgi:low affinity Fe/Cu permease
MIPGMAKRQRGSSVGDLLESLSRTITLWTGSTPAFGWAMAAIVIWAVLGPVFSYSNTWQLVINTGTTIVTFLMVFLIQRAQNKDSLAIHLKLNEIVAATAGASNRLVDVEALSEKELAQLHRFYRELAALCAKEMDLTHSHSVEEARQRHAVKHRGAKGRE